VYIPGRGRVYPNGISSYPRVIAGLIN